MRPSMGSGGPGGKALEKFTIFSLQLVWHGLLKIMKLKLSIFNKKTGIIIKNMHSYVCFQFFLGQEGGKGKLCKIIMLNL